MSTRLETARLIIRTFEPRDAESWIAMVSDPDFGGFLPAAPAPTLESAQSMIEQRRALEQGCGHAMWAIDAKETGTFVGQAGLVSAERKGPEVELGYHFDRASWGKGCATEAAIAVLAHGLGPVGLDRVIAVVVPENVASCRVVEKAGMRFEEVASYYDMPGLRKYVAERTWWSPPRQS